MAELFDASKQNISLHLKNIFQDGEVDPAAVVKESLTTAADGKRYRTQLYKRQNQLTDAHIAKIIETYQLRKEEPRYARRVGMEEIKKNDFNLNISRYVSMAVGEAEIDLDVVHVELVEVEQAIADAKQRHNGFLKELGLRPLP